MKPVAADHVMMQLSATIIIPAHNEAKFLPALFASIERFGPDNREIILVDNGSLDETSDVGRRNGAAVVHADHVLYPSVARNLGFAHSIGDGVLVFLDADVVLTREWHEEFSRQMESLQREPLQVTGGTCDVSSKTSWIERAWFAPLRQRPRSYINGANIITTHKAFREIGGFDETLATGEDVEFCARAEARNCRVVLNNGFRVHHEGYPKNCSSFIRRERWHGSGDLSSLRHVIKSKVAIGSIVFLLAHVLAIFGIIFSLMGGSVWLPIAAVGGILGICATSALRVLSVQPPWDVLGALAVSYLYFLGRALSLWDAIVASWKTLPSSDVGGRANRC